MARLTPLEIQKHRFSRKWKGLDPSEVGAFLDMAAEEMEALARENAGLQGRIRGLEEENVEHRERERVLKDTLLSAQRASDDIRGAAQTKAELMVQEAEDSAERLTHNAMQRAAEIEKAIHELKLQRAAFRLEVQKMLELFHEALEMDRKQDEQERPLSYLRRNPG
ncbi:MAG TPA: DivIVA domain-containing protein [Thermoanaerobaculia bacterium]